MAPDRRDRATLRAELLALIVEYVADVDATLADDTPLISSGIVESITLLHVVLWVEECLGADVDISAFDLAAEWDSLESILDFVERHAPSTLDPGRRAG